ncbi:MAG: hypothetical protein AAF557_15530 [Pseudomonadota bacterium]
MASSKKKCVASLTDDEKASLKSLCGTRADREIPSDHVEKLLVLRLIEVNWGELYPTSSGRSVLYAKD